MGAEGANVIFDTWVHPLVMGLEEHLLTMFREDFEFSDNAGPSHHAAHSPNQEIVEQAAPANATTDGEHIIWLSDAEKELRKIPFFVRGKARRNTEQYATDRGVAQISIETLYEAKAHYAR
jgi:light-independent protochlorophyllide reductase subunit B